MKTQINNSNSLTILGHLDELRNRIIFSVCYLVLGILIALFFAKDIIVFLKLPAVKFINDFVVLKPTEVIAIYFKISLCAGSLIACPAIFYHAWKFIKPAIPEDVNISVLNWFFAVLFLFISGIIFAFKILVPAGLNFLFTLSKEIAVPMIALSNYISFVLSILILGGVIFEMPVLAALLTKLRIISPALMKRKRKEAIFTLFVLAAILTPTTDIFNMIIFVMPMIVLYEISIIVASVVQKSHVPGEEIYAD